MKAVVLVGLLVALAAAVVAFAVGLLLLGYAAVGCGGLWRVSGHGRAGGHRPRSSMIGGGVMAEPVADVLTRVTNLTSRIGPLLVELLNHPDMGEQAEQLRALGQHVGSLSAELLARAAELDGRVVGQSERVVIDVRVEP